MALAALVVSVVTALDSIRTRRRQERSEKSQRELAERLDRYRLAEYQQREAEASVASIRLELIPFGDFDILRVSNAASAAPAREVRVEATDRDGDSAFPVGETDKLPIERLEPGDSADLWVAFTNGPGRPWARATWTNPDGTEGHAHRYLDL